MDDKVYIFVSHSHNDINKVRIIRNYLEELGAEPILFFLKSKTDKDEITQLIKDEIDARLWFIYCESENAKKSEWVKTEIDYIKETNKVTNCTINLDNSFDVDSNLSLFTKEKIKSMIFEIKNNSRFFVSYMHKDYNVVKKIKSILYRYNIEFADDNDFLVGQNWSEKVENMIEDSKYFLLFLSKNCINSIYIKLEIKRAKDLNKICLPVLLDCDYNDLDLDVRQLIGEKIVYKFIGDNLEKDCYELMNYIINISNKYKE